jgi:hypothetical protein
MNSKNIIVYFMLSFACFYACTNANTENLDPKSSNNQTPNGTNLDTVPNVVSLSTHILPIFNKYNCTDGSCHGGSSTSGGVFLGSYNGIKIVASNGLLYNSVAKNGQATSMPIGSQKLNDVELAIIKKWIDNGTLNN